VPEHRFSEVVEFINRTNFEILVGNFELDYEDGGIRYRSGLNSQDIELTYELIRNSIVAARLSRETFGSVLTEVVAGVKSARTACRNKITPGNNRPSPGPDSNAKA
jgi:hypothetical protein